jgi:chemotaxis-related protein WspB
MLFLSFHLDRDRYLLDARQVIEVLPLIRITRIREAPPEVSGIFNYRGRFIPAIDLTQVIQARPSRQRLHTRVIVVSYADEGGGAQSLGLIAERVTETLERDPADFGASGISLPHLGTVAHDGAGVVQRIEVGRILPASVRALLIDRTTEIHVSQRV